LYSYARYNNKSLVKQGIYEMVPVMNKMVPRDLRSTIFKLYCCFITKALKSFIQGIKLAECWGRWLLIFSTAQVSVARKISWILSLKVHFFFWPIRCMLQNPNFRAVLGLVNLLKCLL